MMGCLLSRPHAQGVRLQRQPRPAAGGGGAPGGGTPPPALRQLVASPLYRVWLQLGVVLLLLMLVDAGFSGDWSRIGAITTEQEAALRQARAAGYLPAWFEAPAVGEP